MWDVINPRHDVDGGLVQSNLIKVYILSYILKLL